MMFFFLLFLLRVLLRKQWIATTAFVAITAVVSVLGSATPWFDILASAIFLAVLAFVLLRFGLLAAIVAYASLELLNVCPPTLDFSAWYIGLVPIPLVVVALIAIYGFRTSLAGRPLLKVELP